MRLVEELFITHSKAVAWSIGEIRIVYDNDNYGELHVRGLVGDPAFPFKLLLWIYPDGILEFQVRSLARKTKDKVLYELMGKYGHMLIKQEDGVYDMENTRELAERIYDSFVESRYLYGADKDISASAKKQEELWDWVNVES